jgi:hypothetical protein
MAEHNHERLKIYTCMFRQLINGDGVGDTEGENYIINLLIDIRWSEVSRAFVDCLCEEGLQENTRVLAPYIHRLVSRAAVASFGTSLHSDIPSWFLQNYESFLASSLHKLMRSFTTNQRSSEHARWAFNVLFDVADGLKSFLGLGYLASSTGAHALMSAVANARYDFLESECISISHTALLVAKMLSERILNDTNRSLDVKSAFYFFARSQRWRSFTEACIGSSGESLTTTRLVREVNDAIRRIAPDAGLLGLAQEFLDAGTTPERTIRISKAATPRKPLRSAIAKRSSPFVRLLERLV